MSSLIKPPSNYTTIPNNIINDARLSLKAKGLFLYLISKPDGWNFSHDRIMRDTNDGERSILSGLKELENFGLLSRSRVRVGGAYKGVNYILSFDISPNLQNVDSVTPNLQNVDGENVDLQNVDNKKEILSKKELKEEEEGLNDKILYSEIVVTSLEDYPLIEEYVNFVTTHASKSKFPKIKFPFLYASSIRDSLLNENSKNHNKTFLAYNEFLKTRPDLSQNGVLPVGVNIFDLIGRD